MSESKKSICETNHFEALFNEHSKTLRNYMYYKCGDKDYAEDIVQEAYIKLWNNCAKVVYNEALFFLKRIVNNTFLNKVKHDKVKLNYSKQKVQQVNIQSPEFVLEEKEFMAKLKAVIESLPEKQREVFLLSRIDKKTYAEIAALLDLSVKAVEKRMSSALIIMREKIGKV
ncbi:RNA polymerase sigma factor [Lacinutrix salivirga]